MSNLHIDRLTHLELHHLRALDSLLETCSVTRSAERLRITQSAVSHSLRQVREVLDDPLLVRSQGGMVLTPRAEAMREPLRRALVGLGDALALGTAWNPATSTRAFLLALPDWYALPVLMPLLGRLGKEAPGVHIEVRAPPEGRAELAIIGGSDLAVGVRPAGLPGVRMRTLFEDQFVCLTRKNHPRLEGGLDLEAFLDLDHILMSPQGGGPAVVDVALEKIGRKRRVMLRIGYFLVAPHLVAESAMILTAPKSMALHFAKQADLDVHLPPLPLTGIKVQMLWPDRLQEDPGHRWLRGVVGGSDASGSMVKTG